VLSAHVDRGPPTLPVLRDSRGEFKSRYASEGGTAFLIRPDGHLGARVSPAGFLGVSAGLTRIFAT
jgi:hypothetical protein